MSIDLITRADDFGSALAADGAILEAVESGRLVRNVSCMAVGATIEQNAAALSLYCRNIDIGLHFTLNSEWNVVKWTPCTSREAIPDLLDIDHNFHQTRQALVQAKPDMQQIMLELNAQLERLTALGLPVSYVDAHMAPDAGIPGLSDEMRCWAEKKGLLYVRDYYHFPDSGMPAFAPTEDTYQKSVDSWLNGMEEGEQYLYFMHPAKLSDETMAFANDEFKPGIVAWERELEYRSAISSIWEQRIKKRNIHLLRYREATVPEVLVNNLGGAF